MQLLISALTALCKRPQTVLLLLGKRYIYRRSCWSSEPQRFIQYSLVTSLALVDGTRNFTRPPLGGGVIGGMPMKGIGP